MNKFLFAILIVATTYNSAKASKPLKIRELYQNGTQLSQLAKDLQGKYLTIEGYMAPPLLAMSQFFVLTKMPMAVCPFCETEADWPDDILAIYTKRTVKVRDFNVKITVRGILRLGKFIDPETGFLSLLRLENAIYE